MTPKPELPRSSAHHVRFTRAVAGSVAIAATSLGLVIGCGGEEGGGGELPPFATGLGGSGAVSNGAGGTGLSN